MGYAYKRLTAYMRNLQEEIPMKKLISIVLILCLSLPFAVPALAAPQDDEIMPCASLSIRGGMKYETTSGKYVIYGQCIGIVEEKTVTVTLYRKSGSSWIYVDSVSNTDTISIVRADKYVSITQSGEYKVAVTGTTGNSSGTVPYYYSI